MVYNYNKQSILTPLENGQPHIFEELKRTMQDQINEGHQIKIIKVNCLHEMKRIKPGYCCTNEQ